MLARTMFVVSAMLLAFLYGLATVQFQIFPYEVFRQAKNGMEAFFGLEANLQFSSMKRFDAALPPEPTVHTLPAETGTEAILITGGFYQYMDKCPNFGCLAWLVDRQGNVLHTWEIDPDEIIAGAEGFAGEVSAFSVYPIGMKLQADGSLIVTFQGRNIHPYQFGIAKVSMQGEVLWRKQDHAHHWLDIDSDGVIYAPSAKAVPSPEFNSRGLPGHACTGTETVHYEGVRAYNQDGSVVRDIWLTDAYLKSDWPGLLYATDPCDPFHINSVQVTTPEVAAVLPNVEPGDLLTSARSNGAITIMSGETGEIRYTVTGRHVAQHSPQYLPDGTVAIFDNLGAKPDGLSRITRLNMLTSESETLFPRSDKGPGYEFRSRNGGQLAVSPDGTRILVASLHESRLFEFDVATGDLVWQYDHCMDASKFLEKFDLEHDSGATRACYRTYGGYYVTDLSFLNNR